MKRYVLELGGAFLLTLVVGLSLTHMFPVSTPVLAGLVLMFCVYTIGSTSGAHINPAITLGILSVGKISMKDAAGYIVAQCIGALLALLLIKFGTQSMSLLSVNLTPAVFFAELIGAFFFAFGVGSIVFERVHTVFDGVIAGLSLFLGIAVAGMIGSNGIINPAVALGIQSFNVFYVLAPIIGSVIGFQAVKVLHERSLV